MTIAYDQSIAGDAETGRASTIERHIAQEKARARRKRMTNRLLAAGFGMFVLFLWWLFSALGLIHRLIIPPPGEVLSAFFRVASASYFWPNVMVTLSEIAAGFALGLASGVVFGVSVAMFESVRATIYPYLVALQAPPKIVLAPIFVTWFGFDEASKIAMAVVMSFFPMFLNTLTGLASVEPNAVKLMRSLTASRWQTFRYLLLPNALPTMMAGVKLCWTLAVLGVVVGEFVGASAGIGYLIHAFNFQLDISGVFVLILLLSIFTLVVYQLIENLEKKIIFWSGM
ncbi:ABC transporter permease [Flaviflagellibacter deserti]|uniref:ABC transporter permease n=1 Tax=Flaviflagellibacter deserti TaxID=2267266 RepID=A0ABV9YX26_9HYPH